MNRTATCLLWAVSLASPGLSFADVLSWNLGNLGDLDHYRAYSWRKGGLNLSGKAITSASISFNDIRNWDSRDNILYIHLFDSANQGGLRSYQDETTDLVSNFDDYFSPLSGNALIANGTAGVKLHERSFGTSAIDWTYNFDAAEIAALTAYINNGGNFALAFDPDCHYYNNGITFTYTTAVPTPEPGSVVLFSTVGLGALVAVRRKLLAR